MNIGNMEFNDKKYIFKINYYDERIETKEKANYDKI